MVWCSVLASMCLLPVAHRWIERETGAAPDRFAVAGCAVAVAVAALTAADPVVGSATAVTLPAIVALVLVDIDCRRLPDRILLPMYPVIGAIVVVAGAVTGQADGVLRAAAAATACLIGYGVVCAATGGLGFGDVKLAGALGLLTGWTGWPAVATATAAAVVIGGGLGLVRLAAGGVGTTIPFGPAMFAGAAVAVA